MISEGILLKQLGILLISSVKFLIAAPASYLFGYSYLHTLINTTSGGLLGVLFFFFLSRAIFRLYRRIAPAVSNNFRKMIGLPVLSDDEIKYNRGRKRIFTRKNRLIIKIRRTYGLPGIIILTPVLLSIPIGTFLAIKYYSSRKNLLAWLSLSVIAWALVLTTVVELF
ncbi:MAG: hypothetical protein CVU14_08405 [Bacteroidetes bacterium HGW-Bacteroidetes-9]|jgi:hypothetical protein|nr:MAG: hypothetical protein CVU14_08405 [Bacteroidetes bacterium HGW-Bacteroidetes-9]